MCCSGLGEGPQVDPSGLLHVFINMADPGGQAAVLEAPTAWVCGGACPVGVEGPSPACTQEVVGWGGPPGRPSTTSCVLLTPRAG